MPRLRLETDTDAFDLDGIMDSGTGVVALEGVSGVGLPSVSTQWIEGAGDGAVYRGERVLPRDIDLPLLIQAPNRATLRQYTSRLARMLAGPMTLRFIEDDGTSWTLQVRRVGGGQMSLGPDTVATDWASTVVTLRAGDPFWTSSVAQRAEVTAVKGRGLLSYDPDADGPTPRGGSSLVKLRVSGSQTLGQFRMVNEGDAPARPIWTITGPGEELTIRSVTGEELKLDYAIDQGEVITIDTAKATIVNNDGESLYRYLAPAPRFWKVPPGETTAIVSMVDTSTDTSIVAEWYPRRWTVI